MIAHYCEHNTREGYSYEKAKDAAGKDGDKFDPDKPRIDLPSWAASRYYGMRQGGGSEAK